MNQSNVIGYHATSVDCLEPILNEGFKMSEPMKGHWLGKGVYFFVDLYYAVEWEIIGVIKKRNIQNIEELENACIIIADINCKDFEMIDLSTPYGYSIYETLLDILKSNYSKEEYANIISKGKRYIIKIIEELELIKNEEYLSSFDIVCADYLKNIENKKENQVSDFLVTQKQLCVKNLRAISNIRKFNDKEAELKELELLKKNRGDNND